MEVSSHALALDRVDDVRFRVAVLTNVTRDHLDFHETLEAYAAAKRQLFDACAGKRYERRRSLRESLGFGALQRGARVMSYGMRMVRNWFLRRSSRQPDAKRGFASTVSATSSRLPGRFNVWNALAAIGVAQTLGVDDATSARGLAALERVAGTHGTTWRRRHRVVVDYAHTPDALESALRALRETTSGALVVVFGCGGDRDRGKRPEMGAVAARLADRIYVTSDNPRSEDPQAIVDAIVAGIGDREHVVELDRRARDRARDRRGAARRRRADRRKGPRNVSDRRRPGADRSTTPRSRATRFERASVLR